MLANLLSLALRRLDDHRARRSLHALPDGLLKDIGLSRSEITGAVSHRTSRRDRAL